STDHRLQVCIGDADVGVDVAHGIAELGNVCQLRPRCDSKSLIDSHARIGGGFFPGRKLRLKCRQLIVEIQQRLAEISGAETDAIDCHVDRPTTEPASNWSSWPEPRTSREHWRHSYSAVKSGSPSRCRY